MKKIIFSVSLFLVPLFVFADASVYTVVAHLKQIMDSIIPLLMMLAFAAFLWGVVKYIYAAGDEEKRKEAKGIIFWGILGMFILVAFWGLIQIVTTTFGIELGGEITPVKIKPSSGY